MQRKTSELTLLGDDSIDCSTIGSDLNSPDKRRTDTLKDYVKVSKDQRITMKRKANAYVFASDDSIWKRNSSKSQAVAVDDILSTLKTRSRSKSLTRLLNYKIGTLVKLISVPETRVETNINVSPTPHKKSPKRIFFKHRHRANTRIDINVLKITSHWDRSKSTSPLKRRNPLPK